MCHLLRVRVLAIRRAPCPIADLPEDQLRNEPLLPAPYSSRGTGGTCSPAKNCLVGVLLNSSHVDGNAVAALAAKITRRTGSPEIAVALATSVRMICFESSRHQTCCRGLFLHNAEEGLRLRERPLPIPHAADALLAVACCLLHRGKAAIGIFFVWHWFSPDLNVGSSRTVTAAKTPLGAEADRLVDHLNDAPGARINQNRVVIHDRVFVLHVRYLDLVQFNRIR